MFYLLTYLLYMEIGQFLEAL